MKRNTATRDRDRATIAQAKAPCHICGQPIDYTLRHPDPLSFVVDHLVPLARGGTDALANKAAAHRSCNATKAARPHAATVRRSSSLAHPGGGLDATPAPPSLA
jgi:5-methylcytosine-specific restriction endonuclease McrA